MATKNTAKPTPVVAVLNMKGGVGKTTISAHVMRVLYLTLMKKTLLIDFDPQFNLTQTVVPQTQYEKLKQANQTILSVIVGFRRSLTLDFHRILTHPLCEPEGFTMWISA